LRPWRVAETAQAQREAALRSAEEIRASVVREVEETLADLGARREAETEAKHQELAAREAAISAKHKELLEHEAGIVQLRIELDAREAEARKREEQVAQIEQDQSAQIKVTKDEELYQKRLAQTNEDLRKKEEKMAEESATKEKLFRDNCRKELAEKTKKQEDRFTKRRKELEARIRDLEAQKKRFDSRLQLAAEQDLASLICRS
jgi:hypothetical protein